MNVSGKVRISICGKEYTVLTREDDKYVQSLAEKITKEAGNMMDANSSLTLASALSLLALNYLDDLSKLQQNSDNLRAQVKDYVNEATEARMESENLKKQILEKDREISYLKMRDLRDSLK